MQPATNKGTPSKPVIEGPGSLPAPALFYRTERGAESVEDVWVTRASQRLGELKAAGVELHKISGGQLGVAFIRDDCGGDPEVAYAAIALVYCPTTHERRVGDQGEADGA